MKSDAIDDTKQLLLTWMRVNTSLTNSFLSRCAGGLCARAEMIEMREALVLSGSRCAAVSLVATPELLPLTAVMIVWIFEGRAVVGVSVSANTGTSGGCDGDSSREGLAEADLDDER